MYNMCYYIIVFYFAVNSTVNTSMANTIVKLLHISDLHIEYDIEKGYSEFHTNLQQSIISEFKDKEINFVIISGDLGNRGDETNMEKAIDWIKTIRDELQLENSQLVFCAGNHDLIRDKLESNHHKQCLSYVSGQKYITDKKPYPAFETFYQKIGLAFPTSSSNIYRTELGDYIYDTEFVRFYCLNSSWLSQLNIADDERIQKECELATQIEKKIEILNIEYGNIACINDSKIEKIHRYSFNHSENTHQQIDYGFTELVKKHDEPAKDDKLNVLVFHHPEFCLNPLEHFTINGIEFSGSYKQVSSKADMLLCGHIHPDFPQQIKSNYYKTPHFIGATGHHDSRKDRDRPIFFTYELTINEENIHCNRTYYQQSENGLSFNAYKKPDKITLERKKGAFIPESSSISLSSESDIDSINEKIKTLYLSEFEKYLDIHSVSFEPPKTIELKIPNRTELPDYHIINKAVKYTINNDVEVIFDIMSSNIFLYPNFLQCRFDELLFDYNNNILKDKNKKSLYLPIVIDLYSSLLDDTGNKEHKYHCETEMDKYYQINDDKFIWLDVFLRKKLSNIEWSILPYILQINNLTFVSARLINSLLVNDISSIDIIYESNKLDLC